jgi:uncharacterized protein (UPF0332 family)
LNLEDCFEKSLLRKTDPSDAKAKRSLEQARVWVDEAKQTLDAGAYRSGLMAVYMVEDYVRRGELEEEWTLLYRRLRSARHLDQYSFSAPPTEDEVEFAIGHAEAFIDRIEGLLWKTDSP